MNQKRILVTGASGCVGHYISEALIQNTNHELYLLVRNPKKLQVDIQARPGITVLQGDMQKINLLADLLPTIDTAVLTATAWGGEQTFDINVSKTLELIKMLDPQRCEQVIYFSTASVLDRYNQPLKEAGEIGTDYIRSKYDCLQKMSQLEIAPKITKVFPTLVLGGDDQKPYSHLTSGIPEVTKYINLIRCLQVDGSFHFIHGRDIATAVQYLIDSPPQENEPRQFILGQQALTANQAVEEVCAYLGKKIYFRIPLSLALANLIIAVFRIQMAAWDRFCMNNRHFSYENVVNPASLGLPNYCATMSDVLKISGVKGAKN
ncbi:NAD-dependent epimerase/dehydratase family protein [Nodularia spumigena]|jgi:nucleoside-diphosphate-sugar epimerase|uniref:NAD(P)-dependent oxidoreductase n=1 Tax=Nodularia spumigena UHCC 0060 TaxID=3110300 RepID=A0ABU5UNX2_NODSP|nr:NAD(P)-dependent oxidoreductase [Nodularia spumigena]MEA5525915.1 NAD(P)-dependent oxidoreductase [Nodularia spumigena UHCC 0143]MEA5558681.1 NAD(P)-dependent oxidoreductase [Nodularia spumigena CH309]MEA5607479.1 NAD(P)-dependent oxidoreductase [Nodularia spumigena UHCC 0060]MEA5614402.1 NAD(P)-dependent oxidoreductase [Nodularia spumigena UHCC 0040]